MLLRRSLASAAVVAAVLVGVAFPLSLALRATRENGVAGFPLDDPWIHLTYARSMARDGSLAYFPGDPGTAGSTSPLYTSLLALGLLGGGDPVSTSHAIGLGSHLLFLVALWALACCQLQGRALPLAVVLLIGLDGRTASLAVSGMETSLFHLLVTLALLAYARRMPTYTMLALGLGVWVRPDILVLGCALLLDWLLQRFWTRAPGGASSPEPRRARTPGALWLLPGVALALAYFAVNVRIGGSLLPATFGAKTAYYSQNLLSAFFEVDVWPHFTTGGWGPLTLLAVLGGGLSVRRLLRREPGPLVAELGWVVGLLLAYTVFLPYSHRFNRYLVPMLPALALVAARCLQDILGSIRTRPRIARAAAAVAMTLPLALQAASIPAADRSYIYNCMYHHQRNVMAGQWLARNTPPGAVVATHDIGAIAYFSGRRVVDIVGIVTPEAIRHLGSPGYTRFLPVLFEREKVTHLAFLLSWLEVDNVEPLRVISPPPEMMLIYRWQPGRTHLVPPAVTGLRPEAMRLLSAGRLEAGIRLLEKMAGMDDHSYRTWSTLGRALQLAGRPEEARRAFRRALALDPHNTRIQGWLRELE